MDETDIIQDTLDNITAIVSAKTPEGFRVEYHLAPEGCYAIVIRLSDKTRVPFCMIPSKDQD